MTVEEKIIRLKEIIKIADKLKWIYPTKGTSASYPLMQLSEVEKCMLAMVKEDDLSELRKWEKDVDEDEFKPNPRPLLADRQKLEDEISGMKMAHRLAICLIKSQRKKLAEAKTEIKRLEAENKEVKGELEDLRKVFNANEGVKALIKEKNELKKALASSLTKAEAEGITIISPIRHIEPDDDTSGCLTNIVLQMPYNEVPKELFTLSNDRKDIIIVFKKKEVGK